MILKDAEGSTKLNDFEDSNGAKDLSEFNDLKGSTFPKDSSDFEYFRWVVIFLRSLRFQRF